MGLTWTNSSLWITCRDEKQCYFMEQNRTLRKHGTALQLRSCDVLEYVNVMICTMYND